MAFHPYPQVIPIVFSQCGFGPPVGFTPPSTCSWIDRLASGLCPVTMVALLRLAFATAPFKNLTLPLSHKSLAHYTKGTLSPVSEDESSNIELQLLVGPWFQVYFTPLIGVLFTFPSRYWYTIGRCYVFSLGGWSPQIQTRFHVPRPTQDTARLLQDFTYGAITRYGHTFQSVQLSINNTTSQSYNPRWQAIWFGLFPFRSPLLRESL